jgi:hypothetical protein
MTPDFQIAVAPDVEILVEFKTERGELTGYTVLLRVRREGDWHEVRVWDNTHGDNEMHRYTRSCGKQPAVVFDRGSFAEGYRAAYADARASFEEIVDGWETS